MGKTNLLMAGVRRFAFTLFGVLSNALLLSGELIPDIFGIERLPSPLGGIWMALIVPAYVTLLLTIVLGLMIFGSHETVPGWFPLIASPLRLLPFVLADAFRYAFR